MFRIGLVYQKVVTLGVRGRRFMQVVVIVVFVVFFLSRYNYYVAVNPSFYGRRKEIVSETPKNGISPLTPSTSAY